MIAVGNCGRGRARALVLCHHPVHAQGNTVAELSMMMDESAFYAHRIEKQAGTI